LCFTYPGNTGATIKGIDFSIGKGEIFGFLGPSGAGKSTIQKIVIGILREYQGAVHIKGQELRTLGRNYYERIGVAFEFPNLYSKFTALENLEFFRTLYARPTLEPVRLLELVGLEDHGNKLVSGFSKGMRVRLNFIRALLNNPDIVFLDEPTSGLDPVNARRVRDLILAQKKAGKTVLITTHNMNVADEICDRVAFIVNGQVRLVDSPRAMRLRRGQKHICVEYMERNVTQRALFPFQGIGTCQPFLELLQTKEVETIHTLEPTLEDIFVEVTGRGLQ